MTEYNNENKGVLFRSEKKESARHPDYTGSGNYKGDEFWISAWLKESKNGRKFFSFAFTPKDDAVVENVKEELPDDSVPF